MKRPDRKNAPFIAPSLLSADFSRIGEEVEAVEKVGADFLHVDVMDGRFVPNITIGPPVVRAIKRVAKIPLDVHLMIERPEEHIGAFVDAGADILTVHVEASVHLHRTVGQIRDGGILAGVSFNPATPVSSIEEIIPRVDFILVMSVNPGFGGQNFIQESLRKVARIREMADEVHPELLIEVDGGVAPENAGELYRAGADILVAGSAIFHSGNYEQAIHSIREACAVARAG